jgi:hypothetical protein
MAKMETNKYNWFDLSDEEIKQFVNEKAGSPPDPVKLNYTIWLNGRFLAHYKRNPINKTPEELKKELSCYERIIQYAKSLLQET